MSIRIYNGTGSNRNGHPLLIEELSAHLGIDVAGINEHEMRNSTAWERDTTMLVFAGQSVGRFKDALGEDVMERIRRCVYSGAFDYGGICAGVAFALSHIKYRLKPAAPQHPVIKIQNTGLSLYFGLATGPCRSVDPLPYSGGPENLKLINLRSMVDYKSFNAFFWGGPAIIPLEPSSRQQGKMLACLESDGTPLAMRSKFGAGNVSLFSYHPEINERNIGRWAEARFMTDAQGLLLEDMVRKLDSTAFTRFLNDAGLSQYMRHTKKEAVFTAPRYHLDLL